MSMMSNLLKESEFAINKINVIKDLISHIESNIIGKLPEIKRYYDHFIMIFNIITTNKNRLGYRLSVKINTELEQFQSVFNYDPSILKNIILKKDIKQYTIFYKNIMVRKNNIDRLNIELTQYIKNLKNDYIKVIEKLYSSNLSITNRNKFYIDKFRIINSLINTVRSYKHNIPFVIEPNESTTHLKHKDYLCAAEPVYGLSQEEYKELIEDDEIYIIHKCSRKYNCTVSKSSFEMFIEKCFEKVFPKIISSSCIELYLECPCMKINNIPCTKKFSLNLLLKKYNMFNIYKSRIIEKTKLLMKDLYGVDIFIKCPKPDCPNGDGFTLKSTIADLLEGNNSNDVSPIHKCTLCNTIWCAKCNKNHPGRICADDGEEELDPSIKKCPRCKLLTSRDGGCFHMNCTNCGVHWCWECNHFTSQSDAYTHVCVTGNWL